MTRPLAPLCRRACAVLALAGVAGAAQAQCLDDAQVQALAQAYLARTPAALPTGLDAQAAACTRQKFDAVLRERLGPVVGYKVALTTQAMQKRFGTDQPAWGRLYRGMLQPSGVTMPTDFGAQPRFEADLLVRIRSEAIHQARTLEAVLDALDEVIPFIEMPDLTVQEPAKLNANSLSAVNAGARAGVTGAPIRVPADAAGRAALLAGLRDMRVTVQGDGQLLGEGRGSDMLQGHPLWVVPWLAQTLAAQGQSLRAGDVVSLGSFSPLLPPKPGLAVVATYEGLPGAQPVRLNFKAN